MEKLVLSSKAHELDPQGMKALWERIKGLVFSLDPRQQQLGLGEKVNTQYFFINYLRSWTLTNKNIVQ